MNFLISLKEKKDYFLKKENIIYFIIIVVLFSIDRLSKLKITNSLSDKIYYINDFININLIWNTGIGFGILSTNSSLFYNLITILIGFVILFLLNILIISENMDKIIYSIIIGGALGNFYDRLIYKAVPDFIDLHLNNFHWFTFNVADIFISGGILFFIVRSFFIKN